MGRPEDKVGRAGDGVGLTQTLRSLTEKTMGALDPSEIDTGKNRALLVCTDKSSEKWGPRWLGQSGFATEIIRDPKLALTALREGKPDIVVVEAWACIRHGRPLFEEIQAQAEIDVPVFVLCNSTQEVTAAIDADVYEIARKPFDWQVLARRATRYLRQRRRDQDFEATHESLQSALEVANRARRQLRHTEAFEPATGLPNRNKFIALVGKGIKAAGRDGNCLAVAVVGFSRFRMILEALGRRETDMVFAEIARRLNGCVRAAIDSNPGLDGLRTAAVGNIGNGRFSIMLTCAKDLGEVKSLCREILNALDKPAVVAGQTVFLSTSTGAAIYPQDALNAESLLVRSESAMREASERGASCRFFYADQEAAAARRLEVEQTLHTALDKRELVLAYQPINDVMTDRVVGCEALLRWPQPDGSFIRPEEFVPIAEDAGMMNRLGEFVIEESCRGLAAWRAEGIEDLSVAVNVARSQLMDPALPDFVTWCLGKYRLEPSLIEVEISERGVLAGNEDAIRQLLTLKSLGIRVSVDDFGTGDSSIAYLKDMPVDTLKIDRSYIARLTEDEKQSRMVSAMIALAHNLELKVVAEGVETASQLAIIQSLSCDLYQGFLRSPAVAPGEFVSLIRKAPA